jgi:hypothetical protein
MSQDNVELVRRAYDAYPSNGVEGMAPFFTPDHVAYSIPGWPDDSEYHGHDGLRKLDRQWQEFDVSFETQELRDAGDVVVALVEMTARTKGTSVPIRGPLGVVHADFRDDLIGETRYFATWQEALEAAGLSE